MRATGADGGVAAVRGVGLPIVVASPARDFPTRAERAGVRATGADGGIAALWGVTLSRSVVSPTLDRAVVRADRTGVPVACTDGDVAAGRRVGLPGLDVVFPRTDSVRSPALDRAAASADSAGVRRSGADRGVSGRRRADRDLRAPQPAAYAGAGREIARLRRDPLPVGRRERELDSAVVQQSRVDPADLRAVYLHWTAAQPPVVCDVGREVALPRQDSLPARRLPAELDAAIVQQTRDDAPGALIVALRTGGRGGKHGDDRDSDGDRRCCGQQGPTGHLLHDLHGVPFLSALLRWCR